MSSVFSASKALLVVSPKLKLGDYLAFTVLLEVLSKNVQQLDLLPLGDFGPELTSKVKPTEVKKITAIAPKRYVLSFERGSDSVKDIQWHQTADKINLYVSMDQGGFDNKNLKIKPEGSSYDTLIYFGISDFNQIQSKFSKYPAIFAETKNISIGSAFAIPHAKVELERPENGETISELVYKICKGKGVNQEAYSRLLGGILDSTKRFSAPTTRAQSFATCSQLISDGASISRANSLLASNGAPKQAAKAPEGKPSSAGNTQQSKHNQQQKPNSNPGQQGSKPQSNKNQGQQNSKPQPSNNQGGQSAQRDPLPKAQTAQKVSGNPSKSSNNGGFKQ